MGFPYEVYLRLWHKFLPLLVTVYNNWIKRGSILQRFTRSIVKFLRKCKHGRDGISKFRPLTILNTDLKILAKILADLLQTTQPSPIGSEQCCTVKGGTILDGLLLVPTTIEKIGGNAPLINLDQSKDFDRADHGFLEAVCLLLYIAPCVPYSQLTLDTAMCEIDI